MHKAFIAVYSWLLIAVTVVNGQGGATCSSSSPCAADAPCCSEFGFCGSNNFCLGGCDPFASNTLDSCLPQPICKDAIHSFKDTSRITNATSFNGNASQYDWVIEKGDVVNLNSTEGELALLLTQTNGGTKIASTRYLHYGTVTATLKTGRWAGVVTAFITMSNIKDEIDWEFPGAMTTQGQTNYFWQGVIPEKTDGQTQDGITDTYENYHDYTIDWQPDKLSFLIDGTVIRTVSASETTEGHYPNTPSRVELSIWPAGIESEPPGTVQWAGGMINWEDPDYMAQEQRFAALVKSVSIKCADPSPAPTQDNTTSYVYNAEAGSGNSSMAVVGFSDKSTLTDNAMAAGGRTCWMVGAAVVVFVVGLLV